WTKFFSEWLLLTRLYLSFNNSLLNLPLKIIQSNMPTLLEYFNNDFKVGLSLDNTLTCNHQIDDDNNSIGELESFEIKERIHIYKDSSVRLFTYYLPKVSELLRVILSLINQL